MGNRNLFPAIGSPFTIFLLFCLAFWIFIPSQYGVWARTSCAAVTPSPTTSSSAPASVANIGMGPGVVAEENIARCHELHHAYTAHSPRLQVTLDSVAKIQRRDSQPLEPNSPNGARAWKSRPQKFGCACQIPCDAPDNNLRVIPNNLGMAQHPIAHVPHDSDRSRNGEGYTGDIRNLPDPIQRLGQSMEVGAGGNRGGNAGGGEPPERPWNQPDPDNEAPILPYWTLYLLFLAIMVVMHLYIIFRGILLAMEAHLGGL